MSKVMIYVFGKWCGSVNDLGGGLKEMGVATDAVIHCSRVGVWPSGTSPLKQIQSISLFRFIPPTIEQIGSDPVAPKRSGY